MGLVEDAITNENIKELKGDIAIGHVRYSNIGDLDVINASPLVAKTKFGHMSIAHNGALVNGFSLRELLEDSGVLFQTSIDSEVILNLIVRNAGKGIEKGIKATLNLIKGAYALTLAMGDMLIGIRDPLGSGPDPGKPTTTTSWPANPVPWTPWGPSSSGISRPGRW